MKYFFSTQSHYCNWAMNSQELEICSRDQSWLQSPCKENVRDSELRDALVLLTAVVILRGSCPSKSGYFFGCGLTIAVSVTESQTQSQRPGMPVCWEVRQSSARNTKNIGTFLAIQWLRIHASTAVGTGSIPGWGTKIHHGLWWDQKKKNKKTKQKH